MKSDKMPYVIYADIESLIRKVVGYANNPEKLSARKITACSLWLFHYLQFQYLPM